MLDEIGSKENIPAYIERVKAGQVKLMGFGHRIYKNYDPRARIIKQAADQVFEVTGKNPKLEIALELERIALQDEYFIKRKLYPNVDFYSGIIYQAMGFKPEIFTVLFAIPRTVGWLAQWQEMLLRLRAEDRASATDLYRSRRAGLRPDREARGQVGHHLPGNGVHPGDLHGVVRHSPHGGMAGAMAGNALRRRAEDRAAATDLHRSRRARFRPDREARGRGISCGRIGGTSILA